MDALAEGTGSTALGGIWALAAVGALAILLVCAFRTRKRVGPATLVWCAPFAIACAFFAAWSAQGLCFISPATFCLYQAAFAALGVAVLQRERADALLSGAEGAFARIGLSDRAARSLHVALRWARDIVLVGLAAWFSFAAIEVADNPSWTAIDSTLRDQGLLIVALVMAGLYFLGQRRGALCTAASAICMVLGLTQSFLDLFKNTALLPSDVMAWKTAAAVSGGYLYTLTDTAIECIVYALIAIAALAFVMRDKAQRHAEAPWKVGYAAANLACCALLAHTAWAQATEIDYQEDLGVKLDYWDLRNSYHEHGFLVSFIAAMQDLVIDEPDGYTDELAERIQQDLARRYDQTRGTAHAAAQGEFESRKPSIIAIMNESYSDLSIFDNLHAGYGETYATTVSKTSPVGGWLGMSVHGGGTCNSEYEFLVASSMGFLGSGMYPYQQFGLSSTPTLASDLKGLGYGTWAMHPGYPGNWNREVAYAAMGFDTSYFIYDFDGADQYHGLTSDQATYDRALDILESTDGPQFILDITMQNHGGYDTGSIPADERVDVRPDFLDDAQADALDEFLACIRSSDKALANLLARLDGLDQPVAVVFFGDHQPSLSRDYNEALFGDEDPIEHHARITLTPYFIWTNYDSKTERDPIPESSANFLGAQALELIGAPLSDYQKAMLVLHEQVWAVNTNGYCDANGAWHSSADATSADDPYRQLQMLHYLNVVKNL